MRRGERLSGCAQVQTAVGGGVAVLVQPALTQPALTPLCAGLAERLVHLLAEGDSASSSVEDRQRLERLWVLFLSALESFLSDLQTACSLIGRFPLTQPSDRRSLLSTGQQMLRARMLFSDLEVSDVCSHLPPAEHEKLKRSNPKPPDQ